MKWTPSRSIGLSRICVGAFVVAYCMVLAFCPKLVPGYIAVSEASAASHEELFVISIYLCALPVGVILWKLNRLLKNIAVQELFIAENIACLRLISWMCFIVAGICLVSCLYYVFWLVFAGAAALMGLLIRVIKNVFECAKELKDENDYTI